MKHKGTDTIETERLILRRFNPSDAGDMFKNYCSREKVTEYLTWKPYSNVKQCEEYLLNVTLPKYDKIDTYRWAIVWKENNEVIGCIDVIESLEDLERAELGWVVSDDFWGMGIMPEAGKAVINYLFEVGYSRIQAIHDVDNPKSGRVMEKIGMSHEGRVRKYCRNREGVLVDCEMWAIVK